MKGQTRPWRLWGLADLRLDTALTAVTLAVLAWSRFAYLASGPWEWDEVAFARGVYLFDIAAYFPHPPGYPGWIAIGHLLTPFAGEPLIALQMASAAFSVAALWVLAALGRRVAPPAVAVSAALLVLAAPGPWLYAVRGFTSTAASVLALVAGLIACGGVQRRRLTVFSLVVTAAFLIRPNLLPPLAVLWLGVVAGVRPLRRIVPGIIAGSAAVAVAVLLMAWAQGGWGVFIAPFLSHGERHFSRLMGNVGSFSDLGLVKGFGGSAPAAFLFAAAVIGLVVWARKAGRRHAVVWAMVLVVAVGQLVWMQNRTYCRYAVGVQIALAPLVAGAAAIAPPAAGTLGLLALAGWFGVTGLPLLREQHETQLGGWRAIQEAEREASESGQMVVVESELHLFASYYWHFQERHGRQTPLKVLSPRTPEPWAGIDRSFLLATVHEQLYLPSLNGRRSAWGGVSARLEPLTQQRFLDAVVLDTPPLPIGQWWARSTLPDGTPFMWAGPEAELWLPPVPAGTLIGLDVRPAHGDAELVISLNGRDKVRVGGRSDRRWIWFRRRPEHHDLPVIFRMVRSRGYPPGGGDSRALSVQVFSPVVRPPGMAYGGPVAAASQQESLRLAIDGAYGPEQFGKNGAGTWLKPEAHLRIMIEEPGTLTLSLRSPRPTNPRLVVGAEGNVTNHEVDFLKGLAEVVIELGRREVEDGVAEITLTSEPFVPSVAGRGSDTRELGVVLTTLEFRPSEPGPLCWWEQGRGGEGETTEPCK